MEEFLLFVVIGFFAQMIDGSIGMAYGVSSTSFLLSTGVSPVIASSSVHIAEVFTTFVSGISHYKLGNVSKILFKRLVIPGIIGGATGAFILVNTAVEIIKPIVTVYLLIMGIVIVFKSLKKIPVNDNPTRLRHAIPLGLTGGTLDAIGGGGWGPIVTSSLIASGKTPAKVIGSVNAAEFFVTLVQAATFILLIQTIPLITVLGLIVGGVVAAPLAARVVKRIEARKLMFVVGIVIILLQLRTILL